MTTEDKQIVLNLIDAAILHLTDLRQNVTGSQDDYQRARSIESIAHGWSILKSVACKRSGTK